MFTLDPEMWIEIRIFFTTADQDLVSCLHQCLIPLLNRMYIGHDVTAPRKEVKGYVAKIKGNDYSTPCVPRHTSTNINDGTICYRYSVQQIIRK